MKLFNYKFSRRHLAKTFSWRFFATLDTVIIAFLVSGSLGLGVKIGSIEVFTKMILYYIHERLWFKSKVSDHTKRHIIKTFSWRIIGTLDTMLISFFVIGSLTAGFKIGIIETVTKMFLYFLHEKLWYRVNYGLDKRKKIIKKYFG